MKRDCDFNTMSPKPSKQLKKSFGELLIVGFRQIYHCIGRNSAWVEAEKDELASSLDKVLQASIILC